MKSFPISIKHLLYNKWFINISILKASELCMRFAFIWIKYVGLMILYILKITINKNNLKVSSLQLVFQFHFPFIFTGFSAKLLNMPYFQKSNSKFVEYNSSPPNHYDILVCLCYICTHANEFPSVKEKCFSHGYLFLFSTLMTPE